MTTVYGSYQMQLHLAHKERQARFQKAAKKAVKRKYLKITGPSIKFIMSNVAQYYELSSRELKRSMNRTICKYRWLAFYYCKRILNYTFRKIAKNLKIDQKTVFIGVKEFENLLTTHPTLALDLRAIRMKVNNRYAR